jgi:hypothetical protein
MGDRMKTCSNSECTAENPQPDDQYAHSRSQCRTCINLRNKKWRAENKERAAAQNREYRKNNYAKIAAKEKEYRQKNRELVNARQKEYRKDPEKIAKRAEYMKRPDVKERVNALNAEWRKANPDKVAKYRETFKLKRQAAKKPRDKGKVLKPKVKKPHVRKPKKPESAKPRAVKTSIPEDYTPTPRQKTKQEKINRQRVEEILEAKRLREEEDYL